MLWLVEIHRQFHNPNCFMHLHNLAPGNVNVILFVGMDFQDSMYVYIIRYYILKSHVCMT